MDAAAVFVTARPHHQAVDSQHLGLALQNLAGEKVTARGVAVHYGAHDVLRYIGVIGQQLLGVFGPAHSHRVFVDYLRITKTDFASKPLESGGG